MFLPKDAMLYLLCQGLFLKFILGDNIFCVSVRGIFKHLFYNIVMFLEIQQVCVCLVLIFHNILAICS